MEDYGSDSWYEDYVPSYDWGAETDASDDAWLSAIYSDPSRALDTVSTPEEAEGVISKVISKFGDTAGNAIKAILFKPGATPGSQELNLAGLGTAASAIYGLMGGNQVQTGGYNKPIPKLTATREQIPYAADPNRRPGEAGRSYFTDTQYTAPADAAATQAAAKTQAQGIAAAVPQRAAQVNPYEGKYKPAWNPAEPAAQVQSTPASGVAQLLPVPKAQGFQTLPPERAAQTQGNATSAAPADKVDLDAMRQEQKKYASENVSKNDESKSYLTQPLAPAGYNPAPFMPVMGGEPPPPSKEEIDSLQAQIRQKKAANSGIASLPSSDFAYSPEMDKIGIGDFMSDQFKRDQPVLHSTPLNPAQVSKYTGLDSSQALLASQSQAGKDYLGSQEQGSRNYLASLPATSAPVVNSKYTGLNSSQSLADSQSQGGKDFLNSLANANQAAQVAASQTTPAFAAGGLAAGGFVVPADVVAHLGNGSSSSGLALLAEKLNAKPIKGDGDGMSDSIPTHIDGKEKALVANDEAYISPEMVAKIGGGDGKAGSEKLYAMMEKIRKARTGNPEQGKQIDPKKFMPGGIAQLAGGGEIRRFNVGGGTGSTAPPATNTTTTPSLGTSTSSSLSPWAGDYVTNYLGKGQALAEEPYQSFQGPLTAGASDLQNQAFAGIGSLAQEGYKPQTYQGGTFGADQAQQYMNPYLSAALNPQLDEMRRQAGITRVADAGRMTQAGAFGGSRQAIMESEGNRNLLDKQGAAIGQGYQSAYDKAVQQFNTEQDRRLGAEKSTEASRQYSADYGLKSLGEAASLGAVQRGIDTEGINADRQQFEEQRDYPYKMVQYQKDLLQGLPITSAATTANTTGVSQISDQIKGLMGLYKTLAGLGQAPAA